MFLIISLCLIRDTEKDQQELGIMGDKARKYFFKK